MAPIRLEGRPVLQFLVGLAALIGAAALLLIALFLTVPVMAEPGSDHWGERNRPIAIPAFIGGLVLLGVAFGFLLKSLNWRGLAAVVGVIVGFQVLRSLRPPRPPKGAQPVGGAFYAKRSPTPENADTVMYDI